MNRPIIVAGAGLVVLAAGFAALTLGLSGTTSTTALDSRSTAQAGGGAALQADIVAGRIASKYHPLPWVGSALDDVACPSPLPARVGSSIVCSATSDGKAVDIEVRVLEASSSSITWKFDR